MRSTVALSYVKALEKFAYMHLRGSRHSFYFRYLLRHPSRAPCSGYYYSGQNSTRAFRGTEAKITTRPLRHPWRRPCGPVEWRNRLCTFNGKPLLQFCQP